MMNLNLYKLSDIWKKSDVTNYSSNKMVTISKLTC